jgi:hypothetical protein
MKKEVQIYILELLKYIREKFPSQMNHNIQIGEDGRLWLWISINDIWQSIIFTENYEDISPVDVVNQIVASFIKAGYKVSQ